MSRPSVIPDQPVRIAYAIMLGMLVLIGWLHLATLVITTLFGFFALRQFMFLRRKWLAIALYLVVVTGIGVGLVIFSKQAYVTLPKIADATIPAVVEYAEQRGLELPFTDFRSLKQVALREVRDRLANIGNYALDAMVTVLSLVIGLVVALGIFQGTPADFGDTPDAVRGNLYTAVTRELTIRFRTFFRSFSTVIGAQIVISAINTLLTAGFLIWNEFPYVLVIIGLTFLFGLLPIIGNLLSNTLIVGVGFTISPEMAFGSLAFLVIIHKLEYFLNSKIIGDRIKNPMWLTLIGLVVGEKLMGIPGMILAPVILNYLKVEASRARVRGGTGAFAGSLKPLSDGTTTS